MVDLVILYNFAKQYLYTSIEDKALFHEYLKNVKYLNGIIDINTKTDEVQSSYNDGIVEVDSKHNIRYYYGEIDGENSQNGDGGYYNKGGLWLVD